MCFNHYLHALMCSYPPRRHADTQTAAALDIKERLCKLRMFTSHTDTDSYTFIAMDNTRNKTANGELKNQNLSDK